MPTIWSDLRHLGRRYPGRTYTFAGCGCLVAFVLVAYLLMNVVFMLVAPVFTEALKEMSRDIEEATESLNRSRPN